MNEVGLNILVAISCLLFGYLVGGIPNGVVIGKVFFKKDPRDFGSHNSGGTNCGRLFGKWIGILVIALDILKAAIAFWSVWAILRFSGIRSVAPLFDDGAFYNWLTGLGVALGHCYSPYLHFKGGKTVACYMGLVGGTSWIGFLLCWSAFMPLFLRKKVVSLSSLISGGVLCVSQWVIYLIAFLCHWDDSILMWNFGLGGGLWIGWESSSVITVIYLIMIFRHRANIERLKNGEEAPLVWPTKNK